MDRPARAYTSDPKVRPSAEDRLASPFVLPEDIPDAIQKDPIAWQNYQSFTDSSFTICSRERTHAKTAKKPWICS
jgi:hypothetical protein